MIHAVILSFVLGVTYVSPLEESTRFAIVIGHNDGTLKYSDDDAIRMYHIFAQSMPKEHIQLLTERWGPGMPYEDWWDSIPYLPPTKGNLLDAVTKTKELIYRYLLNKSGEQIDVYLYFTGHGDYQMGRGTSLALKENSHYLTAKKIGEDILQPIIGVVSKVNKIRIHLIVDSCDSGVLFSDEPYPQRIELNVAQYLYKFLNKFPELGLILSTDREVEVYEDDSIEASFFSYVVRTGLLGAANLDHDCKTKCSITYNELLSFVRNGFKKTIRKYNTSPVILAPRSSKDKEHTPILPMGRVLSRAPPLTVKYHHEFMIRDHRGNVWGQVHTSTTVKLTRIKEMPDWDLELINDGFKKKFPANIFAEPYDINDLASPMDDEELQRALSRLSWYFMPNVKFGVEQGYIDGLDLIYKLGLGANLTHDRFTTELRLVGGYGRGYIFDDSYDFYLLGLETALKYLISAKSVYSTANMVGLQLGFLVEGNIGRQEGVKLADISAEGRQIERTAGASTNSLRAAFILAPYFIASRSLELSTDLEFGLRLTPNDKGTAELVPSLGVSLNIAWAFQMP